MGFKQSMFLPFLVFNYHLENFLEEIQNPLLQA